MPLRPLTVIGMVLGGSLASAGSRGFAAMPAPTAAPSAPAAVAGSVPAAWKHHQAQFSYFGETTLYSCPGLEDKVREILLFLGARNGLKVSANGCPQIDAPSHVAFVRMEFDALTAIDSPAVDAEATADWTPFSLSARQPRFIEEGDCELVQDMKRVIDENFEVQHLDYQTRCSPHTLSSDDFSVKGEALRFRTANPPTNKRQGE
jgi:hypothetical protein